MRSSSPSSTLLLVGRAMVDACRSSEQRASVARASRRRPRLDTRTPAEVNPREARATGAPAPPAASPSRPEGRYHLVQEPLELATLVPGSEAERQVAHAGGEVRAELGR